MNIKTLIVDDEVLAREKMATLLKLVDDIEIVGQCKRTQYHAQRKYRQQSR